MQEEIDIKCDPNRSKFQLKGLFSQMPLIRDSSYNRKVLN